MDTKLSLPYIICWVKMRLVWLSRITRCRGFGIQSPTDYKFVCNVINDHEPYKEYGELQPKYASRNPIEIKLCRLCFRVARHLRPKTCVCCAPLAATHSPYVTAGCPDAKVVSIPCGCGKDGVEKALQGCGTIDMIVLASGATAAETVSALMARCHKRSIMIAEGIRQGKEARTGWGIVAGSSLTGVTFDLYYCGIAFFDTSRYKQNHIVNF